MASSSASSPRNSQPSGRGTDPRHSRRYHPAPVYELAERLKRQGLDLTSVRGPWRPTRRRLRRPGRNAQPAIPVVTNGRAEIAVDTPERAAEVSGFLNWCGIKHLDPIANLRPPTEDLAGE